ncbi:MAG: hypothetical protein DRQ88_05550 [Epsilonproteobacteria bacterium]|nr:MAG: hypothetical protein DRQ89_09765 [Campylobacterota bacterium]RLA66781.1 MAG: hypothetical protein DRQ88_05550 [Campylobacterota bacterium]
MKFLAFLTLFIANIAFGANTFFCNPELEALPILDGGRLKPLYVTAEDSIKFLAGKKKVDGLTRTQIYCLLSLKSLVPMKDFDISRKIEHVKVIELLGNTSLTYSQLKENSKEIRMEYFKNKDKSSYKNALEKILRQITLYNKITSGEHWQLPKNVEGKFEWMPFGSYFSEKDFNMGPELVYDILLKAKKDFISSNGDKYLFELKFLKWNLPSWALLSTALALISLVLFKKVGVGLTLSAFTFLIQIILMAGRTYISERAPVTNMYETVMFSGFGSLFLGGIIGWFLKEKIYLYLGLGYNMLTLLMMNFATGLISASISPLVPVLRDNFWLSTHVTSVVLSYGALALSWILANTTLIKKAFFTLSSKEEVYYSKIIYNCLKFGTVTLFFGIMLGGVWADYSWGRFWGWDPKETWSLIVFCIYMAILHGKYTSWIPNKVFIPLVALAFLSVMMAWFGVNYILAAGLHSYGFSQGGALFLGIFFLVQILLLVITTLKTKLFKFSN